MFLRTVVVCFLACSLVWAEPEPKKSATKAAAVKRPTVDEDQRIAALFVKDSTANGQLRFLGGGFGGSTTGMDAASLNQLITQKQNMLEQLRPNNGGVNVLPPIYINPTGGTGTMTGTGTGTTQTTGTGTGTGTATTNVINGSPIPNLLPQIVGQAVANGNTVRRRRPNNRRRVTGGNRNRRRGGNRGKPVYVIRPGRS